MGLLKRIDSSEGYVSVVDDPKVCKSIRFGLLSLQGSATYEDSTGGDEACLVVLEGKCNAEAGQENWTGVGGRKSVFDGRPHSIYVPRDTDFRIEADGRCQVALCRAPAKSKRNPELIPPQAVKCRSVGQWNWRREVCDIMGNDSSVPETLIVGETYNPPGNWSSCPPHKHDIDDLPRESKLEEVYFYKFRPPQGFGLQRVYSSEGDLDEAYVINDGDTVAFPRGYHPVVAAPGYELYYLWVLAGEKRVMCPRDDPDHAWLKGAESILRDVRG